MNENQQRLISSNPDTSGNKEVPGFSLLDIGNPSHRQQLADYIADGGVGALQAVTNGLWVDSTNRKAFVEVNRLKSRESNSPLALMADNLEGLVETFNFDRIDPKLWKVFEDPAELSRRISSRCLIKIPVRPNATYHGHELTNHLDPDDQGGWLLFLHFGKENANAQALMDTLYKRSGLIAATSMNEHGQPTVTADLEAVQFCLDHDLPYYMPDPLIRISNRRGSYPMLMIGKAGEFVPRQKITLTESAFLFRPKSNLAEQHVHSLWPEIFGEHDKPFAEVVGSLTPGLFNLAANRSAGEMYAVAQNLGMLSVNELARREPRPPLLHTERPD